MDIGALELGSIHSWFQVKYGWTVGSIEGSKQNSASDIIKHNSYGLGSHRGPWRDREQGNLKGRELRWWWPMDVSALYLLLYSAIFCFIWWSDNLSSSWWKKNNLEAAKILAEHAKLLVGRSHQYLREVGPCSTCPTLLYASDATKGHLKHSKTVFRQVFKLIH